MFAEVVRRGKLKTGWKTMKLNESGKRAENRKEYFLAVGQACKAIF